MSHFLVGLAVGAPVGAVCAGVGAWLVFRRTLNRLLAGPMPAPRRPAAGNGGKF